MHQKNSRQLTCGALVVGKIAAALEAGRATRSLGRMPFEPRVIDEREQGYLAAGRSP